MSAGLFYTDSMIEAAVPMPRCRDGLEVSPCLLLFLFGRLLVSCVAPAPRVLLFSWLKSGLISRYSGFVDWGGNESIYIRYHDHLRVPDLLYRKLSHQRVARDVYLLMRRLILVLVLICTLIMILVVPTDEGESGGGPGDPGAGAGQGGRPH
jgi:hypothetical protein